ncbi:hypothetical protein [Nocardioides sp. HB32]
MPDGLKPALLQVGLAVIVLAVTGALAGVVWEWVWTAPIGVVVDHKWVALDEASLRGQFSATGLYVVVGSVAGLVGGALVALFLDRVPIATLIGVTVGSLLGAALMYRVGVLLGPSDPTKVALSQKQGAHLPAQLSISGGSPWVALPAAALVALALVFIGLSAVHRSEVTAD